MRPIIDWIQFNIPPWVYIAIVMHLVVLGAVAYLILLERKVASWAQDRVGPNRVGLGFGIIPKLKDFHFWGLGQPLADGLKFILKEDYRPKGADRMLFTLAPAIMIIVVIISIAVIPWGGVKQSQILLAPNETPADVLPVGMEVVGQQGNVLTYQWPFQIADLNVGVLFILAVLGLAVYGVVVGGWASNSKYSFLGGLRATANMISYEIPLGLAILCVLVVFGTLDLSRIVDLQAHYWAGVIPAWNVFTQPLAFILFLVCIHAEANRAPFDLAEAEQELVGGYHTEYSSMRFALFFLAEYAGMITTSAVGVALFFGGWHLPWIEWLWPALAGNVDPNHPSITTSLLACIVRTAVFFTKTLVIIFVFMWVRWSLPRFRFDQLMNLAWRGLIPMSIAIFVGTVLVVYFFGDRRPDSMRVNGPMALAMVGMNVVLTLLIGLASLVIPSAPPTNRRIPIANSRFNPPPVAPASAGS
jgi:NADH-quinone oxidoreductase subunit H